MPTLSRVITILPFDNRNLNKITTWLLVDKLHSLAEIINAPFASFVEINAQAGMLLLNFLPRNVIFVTYGTSMKCKPTSIKSTAQDTSFHSTQL